MTSLGHSIGQSPSPSKAMTMNTQTIDLDIGKRGNGQCIRIGQGDSGGTTIKATIYDNGATVDLTGATAQFVVRLPDRIHYYRGTASVSGSTVSYVCDESKLAASPGFTDEAYFVLAIGGKTYSTERFSLDILRSTLDGLAPAASGDVQVDAAVKAAQEAASAANSSASAASSSASAAIKAASSASAAATDATQAAAEARSAVSLAGSLYLGYDTVGDTSYITLVDKED